MAEHPLAVPPAWLAPLLAGMLWFVLTVIVVYTIRHYWFSMVRLFGTQRHPYLDVQTADWPTVTVLVPAHNEEAVIAHALDALMSVDYPANRLTVIPVNDRSSDRTREIIDDFVARYPGRIQPFHRTEGTPGKAAALLDVTSRVRSDVILVFDADYIPPTGLVKHLVAPFFDPEVGAVMGRVVPVNVGRSLLTRLLDLERTGGYQADQQARMNLRLVPQYGGTVGGVRRSALESVGGWRADTLAEDTDVTYRLLLRGWQTVYENRAECYEEVPEHWPTRVRQIMRWARGHNEAARRYALDVLRPRSLLSPRQRLDALLLLGVYAVAPLMLLGWALALSLLYLGHPLATGGMAVLATASYSTLGNFAAFFEAAAAARLDGTRGRIRLLPLLLAGFVVSAMAVTRALLPPPGGSRRRGGTPVWHKTERYRTAGAEIRPQPSR